MPPIQIRNVPDEVHAKLKAKADARGQSLSEYALTELRLAADRISVEEALTLATEDGPIGAEIDTAAIVRELRGPL